jgi:CTP:molybdopterin cytidylyltransferase MocA
LRSVEYVILAAGASERMGFPKAITALAGASPIERMSRILEGRSVTVVTTQALEAACSRAIPGARVLVNANPQDGMNSSLLTAHRSIDPGATIGVLLADKPFVREETLARCERGLEEAPQCDVVFPVRGGEPGHPVYFAPRARARLSGLPAGDTLRAVRDDPQLVRLRVECFDAGISMDLDTPDAWRAAEWDVRHA